MGEFVKVGRLDEIAEGSGKCIEVRGKRIAVFRIEGDCYAVDDTCPHAEASLSEGDVTGFEVVCPLHFATFNIMSGQCTGPPADEDLTTYAVRVNGDDIEVEI